MFLWSKNLPRRCSTMTPLESRMFGPDGRILSVDNSSGNLDIFSSIKGQLRQCWSTAIQFILLRCLPVVILEKDRGSILNQGQNYSNLAKLVDFWISPKGYNHALSDILLYIYIYIDIYKHSLYKMYDKDDKPNWWKSKKRNRSLMVSLILFIAFVRIRNRS